MGAVDMKDENDSVAKASSSSNNNKRSAWTVA